MDVHSRTMVKWLVLLWSCLFTVCWARPTSRLQQPAFVIKFIALFPSAQGPMAYCDYNTSPRSRNPCDYRIHFDVLFPDDPEKIPYADLQFILPNNQDYFIADPDDAHWLAPLPNPSYPGEAETLSEDEYMHILRDESNGSPIKLRITVFDRDDVGKDDMIAQEEYSYSLNDALRMRERIQTKAVACLPGLRCRSVQIKYMFYLLDDEAMR